MSAAPVARPQSADRSPLLGVVLFFAAALAYLFMPAILRLAAGSPPLLVTSLVFGALAAVGVFAAVTRRGRGWAVAAIVVALANSASPLHLAIIDLVDLVFG